jgi:hypothetical protein
MLMRNLQQQEKTVVWHPVKSTGFTCHRKSQPERRNLRLIVDKHAVADSSLAPHHLWCFQCRSWFDVGPRQDVLWQGTLFESL